MREIEARRPLFRRLAGEGLPACARHAERAFERLSRVLEASNDICADRKEVNAGSFGRGRREGFLRASAFPPATPGFCMGVKKFSGEFTSAHVTAFHGR